MNATDTVPPMVETTEQWRHEVERLSVSNTPRFVNLRAQLPDQGRTNQVIAATPTMSVVLKTYASGGENGLHAHPNEDHVFLILQGAATFHGPKGETRKVGRNDCVMLPRGSLYWFAAEEGGEALVLVRIGAAVDTHTDVLARIDARGDPFDGGSEANKPMPLVLSDKWFG